MTVFIYAANDMKTMLNEMNEVNKTRVGNLRSFDNGRCVGSSSTFYHVFVTRNRSDIFRKIRS